MNSKQRDRGRILTAEGSSRLQQAIRAWELEHAVRCTQERIRELTSSVKEGGLDPGTIRKILKAKEGVAPKSIRCLFATFGLQLNEADLVSSLRLQVQADPNFVGRGEAIADLNLLVERGAKVIVIQARGGVGKTTLARKYLQQEFGSYLEFPIAKETKDIASIESLLEEKLRQLGEEPGREFFVSLDRLKRKLQSEQVGILIDNLEPALDSAGKLIEPHRRYVELLRVLADPSVRSATLITTRERLRESSITVEHYILKNLDVTAWKQFFQSRSLSIDTPAFAALHNTYGGNAKAMDIIRGAVLEDYSGDIEAYWQANQDDLFIERDLEDLVTQQFDRLQQIDLDAYNLLCRMGCYRYQDVPTVPLEGLFCLLWDVPETRQRRVAKSLQDRSLVEVENGEYWLHPMIRSEAIHRLRGHVDWEETNCKAAEFWTVKVEVVATVSNALQAIEPYYHYFNINQFNRAAEVIRYNREYDLSADESLGRSFYRLGLLSKMIILINTLAGNKSHIKPNNLASLYNILGAMYYFSGDLSNAIRVHTDSGYLANKLDLLEFKILSLLNLGFCKIDLYELDDAKELFSNVMALAANSSFHRHAVDALYCLAFIESIGGCEKEAYELIDRANKEITTTKLTSWGIGHSRLFLGRAYRNLGEISKSLKMYNEALLYAEKSNYTQLKANALIGVAELSRRNGDFELAIAYCLEALELLDEIGAKLNLAEAYYQLALTYQAMGENEKSQTGIQESIRLFTEIEAPKQVERVRRSMMTDVDITHVDG
ncbi:tetratricopeptide repeat protein [Leptolyngbya ohadii]|uniref:tetratricopeptide repeat protein n=1 Tax=Leptolyngbya ohadii TaxID=1962290 RepID=UPI000B59FC55|nr:tetratricopeptide repeat protein [Leptolyngbya ohadii]